MPDGLDHEQGTDELGTVGGKKRRLSSDQVKRLEKIFEVENKLEPERKAKLAEELGLQARQVAIWFQNRRARCKTKQLEREYSIQRANYDSLKLHYNNLEQEKEALLAELRELKLKLSQRSANRNNSCLVLAEESPISDSMNDATTSDDNIIGAGSEPSEETKEDCPNADLKEENIMLSSSFYNPPATHMLSRDQLSGLRSIKMDEQQGFMNTEESCNFYSVDQSPNLYWYFQ